jgi:hypothetical protein
MNMGASLGSDGTGGSWPHCTAGAGPSSSPPLEPGRCPSIPPQLGDQNDSTRRLDGRDFGSHFLLLRFQTQFSGETMSQTVGVDDIWTTPAGAEGSGPMYRLVTES